MILFRADGNGRVGSGHVMRCLSLAEAAARRGKTCCFLTASGDFRDIIHDRGHRCVVLGTDYAGMESELPEFIPLLRAERPEWVVVDSYYVTGPYLTAIRQHAGTAALADGPLAFPYPVDVLINYNLFAQDIDYRRPYREAGLEPPRLLLGTKYAPLRGEFQGLAFRRPSDVVRNVLVSTGGADPEHVALRLLQYLREALSRAQGRQFHLVLGAMNRDREEILALAEGLPVTAHQNVRDMRGLMAACDAALSAAGSTLYELCASSMPIVTYVLADNQVLGAEGFVRAGAALLAGDVRTAEDFPAALFDQLDRLCRERELRRSLAERAYRLVDGNGASRVIDAILGDAP